MTADPAPAAIAPGHVAVITGAASGIGFAVAKQLAARHMKVVIADRDKAQLERAVGEVAAIALGGAGEDGDVLEVVCDVSKQDDLFRLADATYKRFGEVSFLMNNAGVGNNPGKPWENPDAWKQLLEVNFWGAVHGVEAFAPRMLSQGTTGLIVNTGSKQGITTPPGNLAYNASKSALKVYTEGLAHELRNNRRRQDHRASPDSGFHLHRPHHRRDGKARRGLDCRSSGRIHAGVPCARRLLYSLPGQ